jgi:Zn-dependent protease/CBS domain-containing protein
MPGSFPVARIFGIRVEINFSWLIIFVLLAASLAVGWFPQMVPSRSAGTYWIMGIIASFLLFASVLAHELAHSLVARARGLPVSSITLFIFGGVSNLTREPRKPSVEFIMALVGPVTSLVIGGISWVIGLAVGVHAPLVAAVLIYLGVANVLLGVFNLIPGFPLDGGRVLRSIIWGATGNSQTATRWAARVGQVVAFLFILWGIWQFFAANLLGGIWLIFIGWFLLSASQAAVGQATIERLFQGVTAADVMNPAPIPVPPEQSISNLLHDYFIPRGLRAAPVMEDGRLLGLVTLSGIRHIPRERWSDVPVREAMVPIERLHMVHPEQKLKDVLPLMAQQDVNQLPVVDDGRLVGMIGRDSIVRYLEVWRGMSPTDAERNVDLTLPRRSA